MAAERDLELALMRHQFKLEALDDWRKTVDATLAKHDHRIGNLTRAEDIADAVADKLNQERKDDLTTDTIRISRWQARFAGIAVLVAIASPWIVKAAS